MPIKEQLRSADSEVQRCMALCAPAFQSAHRVDAPWVRAPMNRLCAKAFAQSLYCGSIIVPILALLWRHILVPIPDFFFAAAGWCMFA